MPKPKQSLALFELVHRVQQGSLESGIHPDPDPPARQDEPPEVMHAVAGLPVEPVLRKDGHRVRLSLSTAALAVVIVVLAMMTTTAYFAGRQQGQSLARRELLLAASGEIQLNLAREGPARPEVLQNLDPANEQPRSQAAQELRAERGPGSGWVRGFNYIWVDNFDSLKDAEHAQAFLDEQGVACTPVPTTDRRCLLVTNQGFDYGVAEQKVACQRLESKIRELGKAYESKGGRYHFNCQVTKLKGDQW